MESLGRLFVPHSVPQNHLIGGFFFEPNYRFPGQEHVAGNSKIPSLLYYDQRGSIMAAGAEADSSSMLSRADDENWIRIEL